jgi:hypothetical protein
MKDVEKLYLNLANNLFQYEGSQKLGMGFQAWKGNLKELYLELEYFLNLNS